MSIPKSDGDRDGASYNRSIALTKADKDKQPSIYASRCRKERALAIKHEIEVAEKQRALVRTAEVRDAWAGIANRVRDGILQLPQKLAPQVLAATTMRQANDIIRRECELLLHQIADDLTRGGFEK